tara:strand:- start:234 stop:659 length:426 start_codon:yes stop_codon:yes gene_type:complete
MSDIVDLNDYESSTENIKLSVGEQVKNEVEEQFRDPVFLEDASIDYREKFLKRYEKYEPYIVDDSYIEDEDKKNLLTYCKEVVDLEYKSFPSPMYEVLIEKIYKDTIKNMNKEEYLQEKINMKNKSVLELEMEKISNLNKF